MATRPALLAPSEPVLFTANRWAIQTPAVLLAADAPLTLQAVRQLRTEAGIVRTALSARSPKVDAT